MANYNILMNRFNGTTHDTLLPKNSLEGASNPTTSTVGIVGQFYLNTTTKQLFQCSTVSGSVYTWVPFYNATQTLDNTTKAKYGLASTATPNDAFGSLANNMVATRKTYPVASGQTIAVKDVVNVVSGQITKAGTPTQAIALQAGTAGQNIEIIYDGVAPLSGITAGTQITSSGVQGYAPQDGWLWVKPHWNPAAQASGSFIGDGASTRDIVVGFKPSVVLLIGRTNPLNRVYFAIAGINAQANGDFAPANTITGYWGRLVITDNGFQIKDASLNNSGGLYDYIAFRG